MADQYQYECHPSVNNPTTYTTLKIDYLATMSTNPSGTPLAMFFHSGGQTRQTFLPLSTHVARPKLANGIVCTSVRKEISIRSYFTYLMQVATVYSIFLHYVPYLWTIFTDLFAEVAMPP